MTQVIWKEAKYWLFRKIYVNIGTNCIHLIQEEYKNESKFISRKKGIYW